MVHVRWSTVTTAGIYFLALLVLLAEANSGRTNGRKREVQRRNKREGSWSSWSNWSMCSRSCGGGIRTQTRICRALRVQPNSKEIIEDSKLWKNVSNRHCEGHSTRHHICNIQPCPKGTPDIRESQCNSFDQRPFMGKMYQWEAYVDERAPCSLTCRAKGFRFFTTLSQTVIDGTSCTANTNPESVLNPSSSMHHGIGASSSPSLQDLHVCISGVCTSIGCDGIAGSQRRLDRCGVCGGDNSTCRVVSGIFTRPQLPVGYNMVAHIPKGACNLNITQIRKSPNFLALRRNDGTYILNGNWAISWPGEYEGVGAKFRYTRQDAKSLETIASPGPLEESVDLLVLYQQPNPGIKYEYMMPMNDAPIPPVPPELSEQAPAPLNLQHQRQRQLSAATSRPAAHFSPASSSGLLPNSNPSNSISSFPKTGSYYSGADLLSLDPPHPHLHHGHHNHHGRRRSHHVVNSLNPGTNSIRSTGSNVSSNKLLDSPIIAAPDSSKKFYWKIAGYTNCSEPCGGGIQTSLMRCVRTSNGAIVPDKKCNEDEKPTAQTTIRCNLRPCPAEWAIGPWSGCSEACGHGVQTRTVHCQQRVSPTLTMRVSEGACVDGLPESRRPCFVKPCHHWETTLWSQCSATCGNGIRSRSVYCVNAQGDKIDASECANVSDEKPLEISPCNMGPCDGVGWLFSEWSNECSEKCGHGIQTRSVVCAGLEEKYRRKSAGSHDTVSNESLETNEIEQRDDPNIGKSESSESSKYSQYQSDKYSQCDLSIRPAEEKQCFTDQQCVEPMWFTSPWSECSVSCGPGLKTRQVLCVQFYLGKFKVVVDAQCDSALKPESRTTCSHNSQCPSRWFTTEWSECSAICGGGVQKRSASCRSSNSNWTKIASTCSDSDRPIERRSCNEHDCPADSKGTADDSIMTDSTTDQSGMVKDTPPQIQADNHQVHLRHHHQYKSAASQSQGKPNANSSVRASGSRAASTSSQTASPARNQEPNEEPDDANCTDQYRNCALVVQARLCRYKYYRAVCCVSCFDN